MGYNWKEHLRGMQPKSLYRPLGHAQSRAAEWKSNEILMTYLASPFAATKGRRICRCQLFICLFVLAFVEITVLLFFGRFLSSTMSFCSSNWWLMMCGLDACTVCDLPSFVRGCENTFRSFERQTILWWDLYMFQNSFDSLWWQMYWLICPRSSHVGRFRLLWSVHLCGFKRFSGRIRNSFGT